MNYMFLIYTDEDDFAGRPEAQRRELVERHWRVIDDATERGVLVGANPLQPTRTATTVRSDDSGRTLVIDGPFAETKEQLAGYYIIECSDLDEAVAWAARIPCGCDSAVGSIEVRPLGQIPPRPAPEG